MTTLRVRSARSLLDQQVRIVGPNYQFDPKSVNYPRMGVEQLEREVEGRVIFLRTLSGADSLILADSGAFRRAKVAGKLDVIAHTRWLSLEISNVSSVYLSWELALAEHRRDMLQAIAVPLQVPIAIIREYQRTSNGEHFDGWSVVPLKRDAISAYLQGFDECKSGGPTRFEAVMIGGESRDLVEGLHHWRPTPSPVTLSPTHLVLIPNTVALLNLQLGDQ